MQPGPDDGLPPLEDDEGPNVPAFDVEMVDEVCLRLGSSGTVWGSVEASGTRCMRELVARHGVVQLRLFASASDTESCCVLVCGNWLAWMPHENHWPPRVVPRTAEFDAMYTRCVSGHTWSTAEARILLADGAYSNVRWKDARLDALVPTAPLCAHTSSKTRASSTRFHRTTGYARATIAVDVVPSRVTAPLSPPHRSIHPQPMHLGAAHPRAVDWAKLCRPF
jgi:hypothetical protein